MTFAEQIKGVPPELVEQGWRRPPPVVNGSAYGHWMGEDKASLKGWEEYYDHGSGLIVSRPIIKRHPDNTCGVYAHQGWGDGLAPTPEMVKVWKWWWISREDGPQAVKVAPSSAVYQGDFGCTYKVATEQSLFLGPVLPPVRQS